MRFPAPIQTYFDADRDNDGNRLLTVFEADAVIKDEGHTYEGWQAIADWWQGAKAQYQHTAEPIDITEKDDAAIVRATVQGNFPGSPATLRYTFRLNAGRIAELEIGA